MKSFATCTRVLRVDPPKKPLRPDIPNQFCRAVIRSDRSAASAAMLAVGSALLLTLSGCSKPAAQAPAAPPTKNVLVTTAKAMDVPVQIHQFGRITSPESVNIQPQVNGRITEVHFVQGQEVKAGDLLFVIDPRPYQADLEQAQAQLASDTAQLDLNQRNLGRDEQIGKQRFVSEQQIDIDRANVQNFQGLVAKDNASIALAKLNLEYCYVKSPTAGRTGKRLVDVGNYVSVGSATLVNIQRLDQVYVDFTVSENVLEQLRSNMEKGPLSVDVVVPAKPDVRKTGKLSFLDNTVSPQAGTVLLRATIPNDDRYLWPGQFVHVALTLQVLQNAIVVPNQTVQLGSKGDYLFVVKPDNTVEQREVKSGPRYQDLVVVENALKAGETVVVEGQLALGNGARVNPQEYEPPGKSNQLTNSSDQKNSAVQAETPPAKANAPL
jgi:multidrug efflux system membrane fusion protein